MTDLEARIYRRLTPRQRRALRLLVHPVQYGPGPDDHLYLTQRGAAQAAGIGRTTIWRLARSARGQLFARMHLLDYQATLAREIFVAECGEELNRFRQVCIDLGRASPF